MVGVAEPGFGGERVALQPLQELRAVRRNDVRLRVVDVGIDETGQDQLSAIVGDRGAGGNRGEQSRRRTDRRDATVADHEHAVGEMAMRGIPERRRITDEIDNLAAEGPDVRGAVRLWGWHRQARRRVSAFGALREPRGDNGAFFVSHLRQVADRHVAVADRFGNLGRILPDLLRGLQHDPLRGPARIPPA